MSYLKDLQCLSSRMWGANCTPLIITAEPIEHLAATRTASGYTGQAIVDPTHAIAQDFKERGLLDVAITPKNGYEHGMAQPAILELRRDYTALYAWAIVPAWVRHGMNLGMTS